MTITISMPEITEMKPRITVFGVGGAGGNAINNMIEAGLEGVEFVAANTDAQALALSRADRRIQLGAHITQGLGAGARPGVGRAAAEESLNEIEEHLNGSHMVFITAGLGGGTGTGAAPVIARIAREREILTVGVVTKPFHFEGSQRMKLAEQGLSELQQFVDTLIIIPNQNLFRIANEKTTFADAFSMADQVLHAGVRGVTDLMVMPGLINLDFSDIRTIMSEMGKAMMGTGEAEGEKRATEAAEAAISNPLLDDVSMKGARGVLINITGGKDLTLFEVDEAANRIREEVDPEANIIIGSTFVESLEGKMRVSVVATGIGREEEVAMPESERTTVRPIMPQRRPEPVAPQMAAFKPAPASAPAMRAEASAPVETKAEPTPAAPVRKDEETRPIGEAAVVARPSLGADTPFVAAQAVEVVVECEMKGEADPFAEAALTNGSQTETHQHRRGPSLFERMTGLARSAPKAADTPRERQEPTPMVRPLSPNPSDRIVTPRRLEDQLEIPTFLRRQAN